MSLWEAIRRRRSLRDYTNREINIGDLSLLLWATQGLTHSERGFAFRAAPSAGATYPVETYVMANGIRGLERSIYHLDIKSWELELTREGDHSRALASAALGQMMVASACAVFIWTAVAARTTSRYGERGYRYIFMDAGHICQNLYLAATALGLGCCAIGAFRDEEVNKILGIDGKRESAIYMATVGTVS